MAFESNQCDSEDDCEVNQFCLAVGSVGQRICTDCKFPYKIVYNLIEYYNDLRLYCI